MLRLPSGSYLRVLRPDQVEAFGDHPDDLTDVLAEAAGERWQPTGPASTQPTPQSAQAASADHGGHRIQRPAAARTRARPRWWFHVAWWVTIILVTIGAYRLVA